MNRRLFQFRYSFEREVVEYFAVVTIGSTGAPTLTIGKGISSITRNSAGQYTLRLQDASAKLLGVNVMFNSGTSAAAAPIVVVEGEDVADRSTPEIILQCRAIDNSTATDPADGEIMMIKIAVRNASN